MLRRSFVNDPSFVPQQRQEKFYKCVEAERSLAQSRSEQTHRAECSRTKATRHFLCFWLFLFFVSHTSGDVVNIGYRRASQRDFIWSIASQPSPCCGSTPIYISHRVLGWAEWKPYGRCPDYPRRKRGRCFSILPTELDCSKHALGRRLRCGQ